MEFERSLYRVYIRSLETLVLDEAVGRSGCGPGKVCRSLRIFFGFFAVVSLVSIPALHMAVNQACLSQTLANYEHAANLSIAVDDVVHLTVLVEPPFLEDEAQTSGLRGGLSISGEVQRAAQLGQRIGSTRRRLAPVPAPASTPSAHGSTEATLPRAGLASEPELQRLEFRFTRESPSGDLPDSSFEYVRPADGGAGSTTTTGGSDGGAVSVPSLISRPRDKLEHSDAVPPQPRDLASRRPPNQGDGGSTDFATGNEPILKRFYYSYCPTHQVGMLDRSIRQRHDFREHNVTLLAECLLPPSSPLVAVAKYFTAIDADSAVMLNGIYATAGEGGHMRNEETEEDWVWLSGDVPRRTSLGGQLVTRVALLFELLLGFALLSCLTAVMVRTVITSGVAFLYPLCRLINRFGGNVDFRLLNASYPWIGAHIDMLRMAGRRPTHVIGAHLVHLVIAYFTYEACQFALSFSMYSKPLPEGLPASIFGLFTALEYFSMIFVRSQKSLVAFPRVSLIAYIACQGYIFATPYGWYRLAMSGYICFSLAYMIHVLLQYEVPAIRTGNLSMQTPRAALVTLGVPMLPTELPPLWSLFMPLNTVTRTAYEIEVPPVPRANGQLHPEQAGAPGAGAVRPDASLGEVRGRGIGRTETLGRGNNSTSGGGGGVDAGAGGSHEPRAPARTQSVGVSLPGEARDASASSLHDGTGGVGRRSVSETGERRFVPGPAGMADDEPGVIPAADDPGETVVHVSEGPSSSIPRLDWPTRTPRERTRRRSASPGVIH